MSNKHSFVAVQDSPFYSNMLKNINIPNYHIMILTWSALVVLYGNSSLILINLLNAN